MEYYPTIEKKKIFNNIYGPWGLYAKWNKSEKDKHCILSYVESKTSKNLIKKIEVRVTVTRGRVWGLCGVQELDKDSLKVQTSIYKINKY